MVKKWKLVDKGSQAFNLQHMAAMWQPLSSNLGPIGQLKQPEFEYRNGILRMNERVYVLAFSKLQQKILNEAHRTPYTMHLGATKMYCDMWEVYWWTGIKKDVTKLVRNVTLVSE